MGKSEDLSPPLETARALSELYTWQCGQWAPIQNSQIIGIYKEIPVYWELRAHFQIYPGKSSDLPPPPVKLVEHWVNFTLDNADNEHPFETVK